ncbi:unnamed protein product, partial [Polarella glacialis]
TCMAAVFSNQGLGYLLASLTMVILVPISSSETCWRFALAFGAVIPMFSLFFRAQMHESKDFCKVKQLRQKSVESAGTLFTMKKYRWHVLGTALNWFLFDILFYGNSMFNQDITNIIQVGSGLEGKMLKTLIIVLMQLPGYYVAVFLINRMGRKNMQLMGFSMIGILFLICGLTYDLLIEKAPYVFLTIYGMTFFFSNFGPNATTYVIPGEIYPSQVKTTLHGVSAAAGKLGAALGTTIFPFFKPETPAGTRNVLLFCSLISLLGLVATNFLTPRYAAEDLDNKISGETVGFVPLRWQKSAREAEVKEWEESGCPHADSDFSSEDEASTQCSDDIEESGRM